MMKSEEKEEIKEVDNENGKDTKLREIKLLFLDVDGVLNQYGNDEVESGDCSVDKVLVERLIDIVNKTGCKIVLSSNWRLDEESKIELFGAIRKYSNDTMEIYCDVNKKQNIYIGDTPDLDPEFDKMEESARTEEILYVLENVINEKNGYKVTNWCVVDDLKLGAIYSSQTGKFSNVAGFNQHFCQTNPSQGLTKENMMKIIKILT